MFIQKFEIFFLIMVSIIGTINAQIPSFGSCPGYVPMANFNKDKFLGTWYEQERYFTVTELVSKCVSATYERRADGKIHVNNAITNRITGVQRIISGTMTTIGKNKQGRFSVKYTSTPLSYETSLTVLDTDYDNFAVIWSCNPIGPFGHAESVWVMTRERLPPGPVLQRTYGVLDKYKISRAFFVNSDQKDCEIIAPPQEAIDPTETPQKVKDKISAEMKEQFNGGIDSTEIYVEELSKNSGESKGKEKDLVKDKVKEIQYKEISTAKKSEDVIGKYVNLPRT